MSVAGLGCGGQSRLGQRTGNTFDESVRLVQSAIELGINYLDTAPAYGTESIVGAALADRRDQVVLSTKVLPFNGDGTLYDAKAVRRSVHGSLAALRTDVIDVFHLHAVPAVAYADCVAELVPELESLRDSGAIRFLALSEQFANDPAHAMLERALQDDIWDVIMVGFSIVNQSARRCILPAAEAKDVGVEVMYAVRRVLSDPETLRTVVSGLVDAGQIRADLIDTNAPLDFLVHDGGAESIIDAAYRFARHEPGCDVVLTGTGSIDHLRQNVQSLESGALPPADVQRLEALFGRIATITGN